MAAVYQIMLIPGIGIALSAAFTALNSAFFPQDFRRVAECHGGSDGFTEEEGD